MNITANLDQRHSEHVPVSHGLPIVRLNFDLNKEKKIYDKSLEENPKFN